MYKMTTLSVSGPRIDNCNEIVRIMQQLGISGDVTPNISVLGDTKTSYRIENGCRIIMGDGWNKKFWETLQRNYDLGCAHIDVPGRFNGCVYDWTRQSDCSRQ